MAVDTKLEAAYLLRAYAWALLQENEGWTKTPNGLIPIVPVEEEPKLVAYDQPYIVYGFSNVPVEPGRHFKRRGSMTFVVYSTDFSDINEVINTLYTAFEREDEAARDVNNFTSRTNAYHGLRFGTISIGFMEGAVPEETEGGRQSGLLNIRYEYYVDYNVKTDV